ncbi:hypothetical protein GGTG_04919 [Gaeumannomyces tritici R3-111a-1]|uniref:Uncharacterized protein n=1 Tax=Gaeumannomyces tritici (strain R3-111a-1) TaxID=644352 RepID=J3NUG3_GAET3|nr:hypothetical protein GGTG_04919 [Gaeumannomyces tritici R3-111a-1]EJT79836.1 hypothetical protein GGTG_04919 [Gaeumannomyces tritici R3-111a-1]
MVLQVLACGRAGPGQKEGQELGKQRPSIDDGYPVAIAAKNGFSVQMSTAKQTRLRAWLRIDDMRRNLVPICRGWVAALLPALSTGQGVVKQEIKQAGRKRAAGPPAPKPKTTGKAGWLAGWPPPAAETEQPARSKKQRDKIRAKGNCYWDSGGEATPWWFCRSSAGNTDDGCAESGGLHAIGRQAGRQQREKRNSCPSYCSLFPVVLPKQDRKRSTKGGWRLIRGGLSDRIGREPTDAGHSIHRTSASNSAGEERKEACECRRKKTHREPRCVCVVIWVGMVADGCDFSLYYPETTPANEMPTGVDVYIPAISAKGGLEPHSLTLTPCEEIAAAGRTAQCLARR